MYLSLSLYLSMSLSLYLSCHKCPALLLELQVEGVDQVTNYLESLIYSEKLLWGPRRPKSRDILSYGP